MLKWEKTKGCIGVKQGNRLPCHVAPQSKWDRTRWRRLRERNLMHAGSQKGQWKDWKPPAIPQLGIPTGRGCHRQGLCQHSRVTSLVSSWPAAGRGREQIWDAEEQIRL